MYSLHCQAVLDMDSKIPGVNEWGEVVWTRARILAEG